LGDGGQVGGDVPVEADTGARGLGDGGCVQRLGHAKRQWMAGRNPSSGGPSARPGDRPWRWCSYPRPGAMKSHGAYSWVMSVITSISAGEFTASASRSAPRSPSASLTRQDGTPKLFA
jgi:hypothetical protein